MLEQLEHLLRNQHHVPHVSQPERAPLGRDLVVRRLAGDDALNQLAVSEDGEGELAVEGAVDSAVEDLLEEVEDDVVEEVVKRVLDEEVLLEAEGFYRQCTFSRGRKRGDTVQAKSR